ncbi:hypothetical protein [uncultured Acinetobacter sp.]|uniref:hypothetical protein n=1 Tax=uncultured Acinetobacter sp. TaxID=165433 RepID=UPI002630D34A|nr:hypothetical protein [uncultured Acinetobacter sp.]
MKKLFLPVLCCVFLVACQPSERPIVPETTTLNDHHKVEVDLNALCEQLSHEMQQVDQQRTLFVLQQINQNLKVCLPLMSTAEQLQLLDHSTQMYEKFLFVQRTPTQQAAFEQYVNAVTTHPTLQQQHFEQMNLRDQYLVKHQGQSYVEVVTLNDGRVEYRRSPQYLARIFAPYLPEAERAFIQALADQNTQPLFDHQMIKVEPLVLAERALFWESYLKHYPQSRYKTDARYLYHSYSQLLFIGTNSDKVSHNYRGTNSIDAQHLVAIEYLSQQTKSKLGQKALQFLSLIQKDSDLSTISLEQEYQSTVQFIEDELNLVQVNFKHKDCFADAICS